jgi:hypothetical protein
VDVAEQTLPPLHHRSLFLVCVRARSLARLKRPLCVSVTENRGGGDGGGGGGDGGDRVAGGGGSDTSERGDDDDDDDIAQLELVQNPQNLLRTHANTCWSVASSVVANCETSIVTMMLRASLLYLRDSVDNNDDRHHLSPLGRFTTSTRRKT